MRKWLAVAALLTLAACVSPEEQAAMDAAQRQADGQECQSLGFKPGSTAFGNCMLKLKEIRAQENNTRAIDRANNMPPPWWGPRYGPPYWW
ncbi:hypothetical protein [Parvibaculum sp.]|uniref:hypothetical protein n=1 Tax=Parvibaculum sp. TaxID=2024848 RepID=UPI002C378A8C|nr:hypothetical protein [Parvibaculum sp.]HUD53095.1 hypothetical protein [Parvibaculum sp.]